MRSCTNDGIRHSGRPRRPGEGALFPHLRGQPSLPLPLPLDLRLLLPGLCPRHGGGLRRGFDPVSGRVRGGAQTRHDLLLGAVHFHHQLDQTWSRRPRQLQSSEPREKDPWILSVGSHVLFLQGILFYLPHLVWKSYEGKQVDQLLQGLNKSLFDDDEEQKKKNIIEYLSESWGLNNRYAFGYLGCELLNFGNVLGQMFLMDRFLGRLLHALWTKVIQFLFSNDIARTDALYEAFPRQAKCTFHQYGASGTIKRLDYLCILPQNIVNEKVFLVMWFWFVVLLTLSAMQQKVHSLPPRKGKDSDSRSAADSLTSLVPLPADLAAACPVQPPAAPPPGGEPRQGQALPPVRAGDPGHARGGLLPPGSPGPQPEPPGLPGRPQRHHRGRASVPGQRPGPGHVPAAGPLRPAAAEKLYPTLPHS
ncbi:innexin 7 [Penaeus vannamei]|uniref:Innexin n=1 Tax=Penaeus vannamei TaxID=6689 RepID=A0A423TV66_PENVA|nr:innexin 7 [Penaeus vannamei]